MPWVWWCRRTTMGVLHPHAHTRLVRFCSSSHLAMENAAFVGGSVMVRSNMTPGSEGSGLGKTALALALGEAARAAGFCGEVMTATASADWTTFDTIGGYALGQGGALRFREGLFVRAIDRGAWLVVDELNRADADRAFGELLTVLAGHAAVTPFVGDDGRPVSIGSDPASQRRVPP